MCYVTLTCNWRTAALFHYSDCFFLWDVDSKMHRLKSIQLLNTILTLSIRYRSNCTGIHMNFIWLICTSTCSLICQIQLWHWSRTLILQLKRILQFLFRCNIIFDSLIHLDRAEVAFFIGVLWRLSNFWRTTINFLVFLKEARRRARFPSIIWIFLRYSTVFWALRL